MDRKKRLDEFLTNMAGEQYTSMPNRQAVLDSLFTNPKDLEKIVYELDPDAYILEQKNPGIVKSIVSEFVDVPFEDIATAVLPAVAASTAMGVTGWLAPINSDPYKAAKEWYGEVAPAINEEDVYKQALFSGATSAAQNIGVMAGAAGIATMAAANPATAMLPLTLAGMGTLAGGQTAGEHMEEGGSAAGAYAKGVTSGIIEAATEFLPADELLKIGAKSGLLKSVGKYFLKEIPSEVAATTLSFGLDEIAGTGVGAQPGASLMKEVADTVRSTVVSSALMPLGAAPINRYSQQKIKEYIAKPAINKALDKAKYEVQATEFIEKAMAEGGATFLTEEEAIAEGFEPQVQEATSAQVADAIKNPGEIIMDMAEAPTAAAVNTEGKPIVTADNDTIYYPGDTVFVKSKILTKLKKPSKVLKNEAGGMLKANVVEVYEDGKLQVKFQDGTTDTVEMTGLIPRAAAGMQGADVEIGEGAPKLSTSLRISRKLIEGMSGKSTFEIIKNAKKFGFVGVDKKTGKPVRIGFDWALQANPEFARIVGAHELGHIIHLLGTRLAGSEQGNAQTNDFVKILTGAYKSTKEAVLHTPPEFLEGGKYADIADAQEKFYNDRINHVKAGGAEWSAADNKAVSENWDKLIADMGFDVLDEQEKKDILAIARETATKRAKDEGWLSHQRGKSGSSQYVEFRKAEMEREKRRLTVEAYGNRGMVYMPQLKAELRAVSAAMRGFRNMPTNPDAQQLKVLYASSEYNQEMFADFWAAKMLNMNIRVKGQTMNLVQTLAPNLSSVYENYVARKPEILKTFQEAFEEENDVDQRNKELLTAMRIEDSKAAALIAQTNPERNAIFGFMNTYTTGFMQSLVDANYTAIKYINDNVSPRAAEVLRDKISSLLNVSAICQSFMNKTNNIMEQAFREIKNADPDANEEEVIGGYMLNKMIADHGREKTITHTYKNSDGVLVTKRTQLPVWSGDKVPLSAEDAQKNLDTVKMYVMHKPALEKATKAFSETWSTLILDTLQDTELISPEFAEVLRANKTYATYAVFKDSTENRMFQIVAPNIQSLLGASSNPRNPLASTMEKGLKLLFTAHLNQAKRTLVESLPEEMKKPATKYNGTYMEPKDKDWSVVSYRIGNVDYGYLVPETFTRGIEYAGNGKQINSLLALLSSTTPYFRQLFTIYNPRFVFMRNPVRDFTRLWINAYDPTGNTTGSGIVWEYAKVMNDSLAALMGSQESQDVLDEELDQLFKDMNVLSDYDWKVQDAQDKSTYELMQKAWIQKYREDAKSKLAQQGAMGKLFGGYVMDSWIGASLGWAASRMEAVSRTMERVPKRAAARYYKQFLDKGDGAGISKEEYNQLIRTAGSPFFMQKGTWHPALGSVFMFYNPMVQGLHEDLQAMHKSRAVLGKRLFAASMSLAMTEATTHALIMALAGDDENLLDPALKDLLYATQGIPLRDRQNATCIPLAITPEGETVYIRIPLDETTAALKRITMKIMETRGFHPWDILNVAGSAAQTVQPTLNPIIGVIMDTYTVMNGGNPYNNFYEKNVIPDPAFKANGAEKLKFILQHFYNSAAPTTVIYRWKDQSPRSKFSKDPKTRMQYIASKIKTGMDLPFVQTLLESGMLKVSAQGHADEIALKTRTHEEYKAKFNMLTKDVGINLASGSSDEVYESMENLRTNQPLTMAQMMVFAKAPAKIKFAAKNSFSRYGANPRLSMLMQLDESTRMALMEGGNFRLGGL